MHLLGKPHGPVHVLGEDAGRQPETAVVGHGDGLVDVAKRADRHRRAEQLFPGDPHVWLDVRHHGGSMQRALVVAARDDAGATVNCFGNPLSDPDGVGLSDHGSHADRLIQGISQCESLGGRYQGVQKVGVDAAVGQHPLGGYADLAGVGKSAGHRGGGNLLDVRIGHDDQGTVGTQLHGDLFNPRVAADAFAHFHAAGKSDLAHPGIAGQCVADFTAGAGDTLDGFFGQSRL